MKKSRYVLAVEEVQKPVTEFLSATGFKKSGRTYNRIGDDGLIHVVNFQMGRGSEYGNFAVNLGIHLPCVSQIELGKTEKRVFQEYDCQIRQRLGVMAKGQDIWWPFDNSTAKMGNLMVSLLGKFGLPFLSTFTNYTSVLSQYRAHGSLPFNNEERSALIAAIICHNIGDFKSSTEFFDKAASSAVASNNSSFRSYVEQIRKLCVL